MKRLTALKKLFLRDVSPELELITLVGDKMIMVNPLLNIEVTIVNPFFTVSNPCSVNFNQLYNAIKATSWPATVSVSISKEKLTIKDTGTRVVPIVPPSYDVKSTFIPVHGARVTHHLQNLDVEDVKNLYRASRFTTKDDLRPAMEHVYIDGENIIGSDAHALFRRHMNLETEPYGPVLIHYKVAEFLRHEPGLIIRSVTGEKDAMIAGHEISSRYVTVLYKKPGMNYPNWESVWPGKINTTVYINRKKTIEILNLLSPLANPTTNMVVLDLKKRSLVVEDRDVNIEASQSLPLNTIVKGQDITIGYKISLLTRCLKNCDTEVAEIKITDPSSASIVCGTLLMPMMIHV